MKSKAVKSRMKSWLFALSSHFQTFLALPSTQDKFDVSSHAESVHNASLVKLGHQREAVVVSFEVHDLLQSQSER